MGDSMDPERLLDLRLTAAGLGGLLPLLRGADGAFLAGRFRIERLLAAGRQSFVFAALDLTEGGAVVVKQAAFDYRKPLNDDEGRIQVLRTALTREFEVLRSCNNETFPGPIALLTATAIVPAAQRNPALEQGEVYLVEEKIDGKTLRDLIWRDWRGLDSGEREAAAKKLAYDFWRFWQALHSAGWLYSDLSPTNLLVEPGPAAQLRVIDAGSVIPTADRVVVAGYTPAFTTPRLLERFASGTPIDCTASVVFPMLAKILHVLLTLREPLNGTTPDLEVPEMGGATTACKEALACLLSLDARPDRLNEAEDRLSHWTRDADIHPYPPW